MNDVSNMKKSIVKIYFLLIALTGIIAGVIVFACQPTPGSAFTAAPGAKVWQTVLVVSILFLVVGSAAAFYVLNAFSLQNSQLSKKLRLLSKNFWGTKWFLLLIGLLCVGFFISGNYLLIKNTLEKPFPYIYFQVVSPILWWIIWVSSISIIVLVILSRNEDKRNYPNIYKPTLIFIILVGIGYLLLLLGYGHEVSGDVTGIFNLAGYPILGYQVFFMLALTYLIDMVIHWVQKKWGETTRFFLVFVDIMVSVLIVAAAFFLWNGVEVQSHYHIDPPTPPNFEKYPDSDALFYDRTAQSLLAVGKLETYPKTFEKDIARRPLLATYLAALHKLSGLGYQDIIPLQVGLFSFLPVLIYLLTKTLHTRLSGLLTAGLVIVREYNGLLLSERVTGVHSKLTMSEIPTQIGVVLFIYLLALWWKKSEKRKNLILIAGGALGMTMLIRQEEGVMAAFIALVMLSAFRKKPLYFIRSVFLLFLGIILVVSPWIWRNYQYRGEIFLDLPGNRLELIRDTLNLEGNLDQEDSFGMHQPHELPKANSKGSFQSALQPYHHGFSLESNSQRTDQSLYLNFEEPVNPVDQILDHLNNQLILSVVYLPSYPMMLDVDYISKLMNGLVDNYYGGVFYSPQAYVKSLPYWWTGWDGTISQKSLLLVIVSLGLISIGIYAVWKRYRWFAAVPLFAMLGHFIIYALVRKSGGRFIQEVDWITTMFYCVGLVSLINFVKGGGSLQHEVIVDEKGPERKTVLNNDTLIPLLILGLLFLGSLIPLIEYFTPNQYNRKTAKVKEYEVLHDPDTPLTNREIKKLKTLLDSGGQSLWGRALYPQFRESSQPLGDYPRTDYWMMDIGSYPRSRFYLIGSDTTWVILERDTVPDLLPHSSDVLVFGCVDDNVVHANTVVLYDKKQNIQRFYWRDGNIDRITGCPLPKLKPD